MSFPVGVIFPQPKYIDENTDYTLVLCKIIVGRSLCVKSGKEIPKSRAELPAGYDSVYVIGAGNSSEEESGGDIGRLYRHEYVIYNSQQILPCYCVSCRFKFDNESGMELCVRCSLPATIYCEQDKACFCTDCDQFIHELNEELAAILRRHTRVPLRDKMVSFGECKDHSRNIEFFCYECKQPLCVDCKMEGNHASGDFAKHAIISIAKAYEKAKEDAENEDLMLKKKKAIIQNYITKTQQRIMYGLAVSNREVGSKGSSVEQKIYAHLTEVLAQLAEELEKKVQVLLSDKYELQRQLEEIEHAETFFQEQLNQLNGIDFINLWINHTIFKESLNRVQVSVTEVQVVGSNW